MVAVAEASVPAVLAEHYGFSIVTGDALTVLRLLPTASVACTITSPPYYGLRSYDLPELTFGGDPGHQHDWQRDASLTNQPREQHQAMRRYEDFRPRAGQAEYGARCTCGAWHGILGLEADPRQYIAHLVAVFDEVRRVTQPGGNLFLNLSDSWSVTDFAPWGVQPKSQWGIPWRLYFALQEAGWLGREDLVWRKPSGAMDAHAHPSRFARSHEYLFHLAKQPDHYFDHYATLEPATDLGRRQHLRGDYNPDQLRGRKLPAWALQHRGQRRTSVWSIANESNGIEHSASFPRALVDLCLLSGTSAAGECPQCGRPWQRQVTTTSMKGEREQRLEAQRAQGRSVKTTAISRDDYLSFYAQYPDHDHGFLPQCSCSWSTSEPLTRPQLVLDPFSGSATTGIVALQNDRGYLGIELDPNMAEKSRQVLRQVA